MAKAGSVSIEYRNQNSEKGSKSLPNVNPGYLAPLDSDATITVAQAQSSIRAAAVALNNLTSNNLLSVILTTKDDITTA